MDKVIYLKAYFCFIFKIPESLQVPIGSIHMEHTSSFKTVNTL